jgi:hypothetical protein
MNQWYYAREGTQHGPISLDELRGLIRSAGIDPAKDLVWNPAMSDWRPAAQVPELDGVTAQGPTVDLAKNPYSPPASGWEPVAAVATGEVLAEIAPGSDPLDPVACIKRGFELTIRHIGKIVLVFGAYLALAIGFNVVLEVTGTAAGWQPSPTDVAVEEPAPAGNPVWLAVSTLLSQVFSIFLSLGFTRIGLNIVSGRSFSVGMLLAGGHLLPRAVLASLLFYLMVGIGMVLLIFPGVYLALRYGQYLNALVDRDLGVIDSFKYSSTITTGNRVNLFLLFLLMMAVIFVGCLALGLGLLVAIPVTWLGWTVAFRWMQYGRPASTDLPGTKQPALSSTAV